MRRLWRRLGWWWWRARLFVRDTERRIIERADYWQSCRCLWCRIFRTWERLLNRREERNWNRITQDLL